MTISAVLSAVKPNKNNIIEGSWDIGKGIWGPIGWEKKSYSECSMKICKDEAESLVSLRAGAQGGVGGQAGRQPGVRLCRTEPFGFCFYCIRDFRRACKQGVR